MRVMREVEEDIEDIDVGKIRQRLQVQKAQ